MSDFDFEELDKAVTGALAGPSTTSRKTPPVPQEESLVNSAPVEPAEDSTTNSEERVTPAPTTPPEPTHTPTPKKPSAPAARRPTGRFMDVVHPSSDMRTAPATPSKPVEAPVEQEPPKSFFGPIKKSIFTNKEIEPEFEEEEIPSLSSAPVLDTPFLPDAKVEKRPLGGSSQTTAQALHLSAFEQPKNTLLEAPDEPLLEDHVEEPLEEEVVQDLPPMETPHFDEPKQLDVEPVIEATPATSIVQQYTEHQREESDSGAIYDTEAYHQPLAVSAKKSSGLWLVVWIVVLALVGAGAGLLFYFLILPAL
jgi:hypothetical protein